MFILRALTTDAGHFRRQSGTSLLHNRSLYHHISVHAKALQQYESRCRDRKPIDNEVSIC